MVESSVGLRSSVCGRSCREVRRVVAAQANRLRLVKRMKTLEFSLEEMGELLGVLGRLDEPETDAELRTESIERLVAFRVLAQERCADLRSQLETAESFAADLRGEISRQRRRMKEVR